MTFTSLNDDARLSRQVVRLEGAEGPLLWQTVTRQALPLDADEDALRAGHFLAGQEAEAVARRLFAPRRTLTLTVVVTWECNLRCNHCTVLGKLVKKQTRDVNVDALCDFVRRFQAVAPEIDGLKLSFLGGEPLLRPELCRELITRTRELLPRSGYDTTTNLAMPLGEEQLAVIRELDAVVVSLDGLAAEHNTQRRPFQASFDPFERTVANLARLAEEGLAERVHVQGAIRDEFATVERFQDFQRELMRIGVPWNQIRFETVHPAPHKQKPERTFLESLAMPVLRSEPCCKYRGARKLVVDHDDALYSDFYDWQRLGTLGDEIPGLLERHREIVLETMPALHDPECRACPVIGYCWGGCTNARPVTGERPSAFCGQEALTERVKSLAAAGELAVDGDDTACNL